MYISLFDNELQEYLDKFGLEHEDPARLAEYISLMYVSGDNQDQALEENLAKWIDYETESYYGQHETPADFARYFFENYETETQLPSYLAIDWQATWDRNLRHDFYFSDSGYVWAEVY